MEKIEVVRNAGSYACETIVNRHELFLALRDIGRLMTLLQVVQATAKTADSELLVEDLIDVIKGLALDVQEFLSVTYAKDEKVAVCVFDKVN